MAPGLDQYQFHKMYPIARRICVAAASVLLILSNASAVDLWTSSVLPSVTSIEPNQGPESGGTQMFVIGDGFLNTKLLTCLIGLSTVPATWISPQVVTCTTPAMRIGFTVVTVDVSNNGVDFSGSRVTFQVVNPLADAPVPSGVVASPTPLPVPAPNFTASTQKRWSDLHLLDPLPYQLPPYVNLSAPGLSDASYTRQKGVYVKAALTSLNTSLFPAFLGPGLLVRCCSIFPSSIARLPCSIFLILSSVVDSGCLHCVLWAADNVLFVCGLLPAYFVTS